MSLQRVPINNFRGGLNTRDSPFDLQPNESPDLQNVTVSNLVGQLQVRRGRTRFDDGSMTGHADNMYQMVLSPTIRFLMVSIGGAIYSCTMGGTLVRRYTGTAGTVWFFQQMPDATGAEKLWAVNGVDPPQKWDGVTANTLAWAATTGSLPNGNVIKVYGNRMFILGVTTAANVGITHSDGTVTTVTVSAASAVSTVYFSPFGDPEATTGYYGFLQLRGPENELDWLLDMEVLGTRLYLFKRESVWVVNDPSTMANRRLGGPGVSGRFMLTEMNSKLYWFNAQGLWSTQGVAIAYESGSINSWFPNNLNANAIATARLVSTHDSYQRMYLAVATGSNTVPNILIEYVPNINFRRIGGRRYLLLPAFFIHTIPCQSIAAISPSVASGWSLISSDSVQQKLYNLFTGSTDDGAAISGYWKSSWMAIQGEEPFERIRRCNVELYGDAIVEIYKDFLVSPDFIATLPNPATSGDITWDNPPHVWDEPPAIWDPPGQYRFVRVRPESRGRFHQLVIRTLTGGVPFLVNVAELAVRGGKEH